MESQNAQLNHIKQKKGKENEQKKKPKHNE